MPLAVIEVTASVDPLRKRWTRPEYDALSSSGVLNDQRLELIQGELINKMGKGRPHTNSLVLLQGWAIGVFGLLRVNPEATIDVSPEDNPTNEPEPDLIVLKLDLTHHQSDNPGLQDLDLV